MRALIAEDDFINRRVMQLFLASYGKCDVADNGKTAIRLFKEAMDNKKPYNMVCLDLTLPEVTGQELLRGIRELEQERGIFGRDGARVMVISAESGKDTLIEAFRNQCDGFMLKPFRKRELIRFMQSYSLISGDS